MKIKLMDYNKSAWGKFTLLFSRKSAVLEDVTVTVGGKEVRRVVMADGSLWDLTDEVKALTGPRYAFATKSERDLITGWKEM